MTSALTWFEIPSADFDRAVDFYSTLLGKPLHKEDFNGVPNGIFPYEQGKGIGGSVPFSRMSRARASVARWSIAKNIPQARNRSSSIWMPEVKANSTRC